MKNLLYYTEDGDIYLGNLKSDPSKNDPFSWVKMTAQEIEKQGWTQKLAVMLYEDTPLRDRNDYFASIDLNVEDGSTSKKNDWVPFPRPPYVAYSGEVVQTIWDELVRECRDERVSAYHKEENDKRMERERQIEEMRDENDAKFRDILKKRMEG